MVITVSGILTAIIFQRTRIGMGEFQKTARSTTGWSATTIWKPRPSSTHSIGRYPALYGNRIAFTTPEWHGNQDLNGDGKILGNIIYYYNLKTGHIVNTRQLGTEPGTYEDTITFYLWEKWTGQDLDGDENQSDSIVDTYQITVRKMSIGDLETVLLLVLLVIGGITAYLKRKN